MNLSFRPEEEAFRQEVRDFLSDHLTSDLRRYAARMTSVYADRETAMHWQGILKEKGWAAPSWPVEHGGCDWTVAQHYIFDVEMARAGAPPLSPMGIGMCGPARPRFRGAEGALPSADPVGRGFLVSGLFGAPCGIRPRPALHVGDR